MTWVPKNFTYFKRSTPHYIVTHNLNVQMKLLNPVLKKLHTDSVAVPEWNLSNQDPLWSGTIKNLQIHLVFTLPLTCSVHFILSDMILFAHPTSNNFVQFVLAKIPGEYAWGVLLGPPWCWLLLWRLEFIGTQHLWILNFCYLGNFYLLQEVLVHYLLFVLVLYTKFHRRVHSLADTFGHLTVFLRTE